MLKSLDPHSEFMEPDEASELKIATAGEFGGMGEERIRAEDVQHFMRELHGAARMTVLCKAQTVLL